MPVNGTFMDWRLVSGSRFALTLNRLTQTIKVRLLAVAALVRGVSDA
jgi:hypothetical protein